MLRPSCSCLWVARSWSPSGLVSRLPLQNSRRNLHVSQAASDHIVANLDMHTGGHPLWAHGDCNARTRE